jgi:E3 ubiquitin-protein ligase BRE1
VSIYTDLEALDKINQALQTQLHSKVFDLKDIDGRMGRLITEKAKADNRYFQTMRGKEAIEAECKAAQRSVDKQLRLLERARDVENGLQAQIVSASPGLSV